MTAATTVVVATRNRERLLQVTLRSLLGQQGCDLRVVVVDDASTESMSPPLLADPRVTVLRNEEQRGAAASRNRGIAAADTPWVAFCDDDDVWAPTKLATQFAALDSHPGSRWAATGGVSIDTSLRIVGGRVPPAGDVLPTLLVHNRVGASTVLVASDLLDEVGGYREDLLWSEDWDLWIRIAGRSPLAVAAEPLVAVRKWPGSKSRRTDAMERAFDQIQHEHAALAARLGVSGDREGHQRFLAKQELLQGRRLSPARRLAASAARTRDPKLAARAAFALVAPRVMDRMGTARGRRHLPAEMLAAERWVRDVASLD